MTHDQGMYGRRARYYDAIYHWKDYGKESLRIRELLTQMNIADGMGGRVVEAACGTCAHMVHLKQWYQMSGFDISNDMLAIARQKLQDANIKLFEADMTAFKLDPPTPADALLCLFSAIGYIYPETKLRAAARCFAQAIRPGGVIIIEPFIAPDAFIDGHAWMDTYTSDTLKLSRAIISRRENDMAILEFHWLAAETGATEVDHYIDRHVCWLCPRDLMLQIFNDAGFTCRLEPDGLMKNRGLLVGTRR